MTVGILTSSVAFLLSKFRGWLGLSAARRNPTQMSRQPSYEEIKNRLDGLRSGELPAPPAPSSSIPGWVWRALVVAISFLVLWVYFAHNRAEDARARREEAERATQQATEKAALQERISELAKRHDAVTDWRSHLRDRTIIDPIYSAELTAALINPERRPVLFIGSVRDVGQVGGKYVLSLEGGINLRTHFLLHLSCSDEQAKSIMAEPRGESNRFAVVATIVSVDSAQRRDEGASSRRTEINVTGELLGFEYLGPYRGDRDEVFSTFREP
jgi:hypothetical protein